MVKSLNGWMVGNETRGILKREVHNRGENKTEIVPKSGWTVSVDGKWTEDTSVVVDISTGKFLDTYLIKNII